MLIDITCLEGAALDWAVAKINQDWTDEDILANLQEDDDGGFFSPSTNWSQGGPIIEHHIFRLEDGDGVEDWPDRWVAEGGGSVQYGPTALIAAMRAYVESKLGAEIEVPQEVIS